VTSYARAHLLRPIAEAADDCGPVACEAQFEYVVFIWNIVTSVCGRVTAYSVSVCMSAYAGNFMSKLHQIF